MQCKKCGTTFEGKFCPKCGTPVNETQPVCPVCGKPRLAEARFCSNCGHDFQKAATPAPAPSSPSAPSAAVKRKPKLTKKQVRAIVIVVLVIAVLLAVIIPVSVHFSNHFRIGYVQKIEMGATREQVIELFGEPYDYNENAYTFEYYDNSYRKLLEENDSFDPDNIQDWNDFEDAFNDALKLEQKLQTQEYKYIKVTFDSDGLVSSVFFDAARTEENKGEKKTPTSGSPVKYSVYTYETEVSCAVEYSDGSYYLCSVPLRFDEVGEFTFKWNDLYGNEFENTLHAAEDPNIDFGTGWRYNKQQRTLYILSDEAFSINLTSKMTSVVISDGVTRIGNYAFDGCEGLTSINIPDSVTTIGDGAFENCSNLTSITIPNSVTSIGASAFSGCSGLTGIVVEAGNPVYHSAGNFLIETASKTLIVGCNNSVIPNDGSVTYIGEYAFKGSGLTSITIPDNIISIGEHAFAWCNNLPSVTIGNSVTSIGEGAFYGCKNLTSITIPNSVTSIGERAFYWCTSLRSVTIPDSVTSIGSSTFSGCDSLTSVYYNGTEEQWDIISVGLDNEDLTGAKILFKGEW